jgi:glycosyltransferase involved in cell wall biosynthesis
MGLHTAIAPPFVGSSTPGSSLPLIPATVSWTGVSAAMERPLLSIVIPALNEEESIASTIQRCLDARGRIQRVGHVRDIEIIVVSDGSTDRTVEIAQQIVAREPSVRLIVFEKNRGYGAAIKQGFKQSSGELVSFIDADGTCDPNYFGELCGALHVEHARVVLGSRMGPGNQMPRVRRLGNWLYALLLGSLSGRAVTDTASGMRVIHRDALAELYPLPDGLHFTPAMSARAVMRDIPIVEVPMSYSERVGESKLRVFKDGVRFLNAIADAAMLYRPSRIFNVAALACVLVGLFWGSYPLEFYLRNTRLEEWMIYRLLLCGFLLTCAFTLLTGGVMADRILSLMLPKRQRTFVASLIDRIFAPPRLWLAAVAFAGIAVALVWTGLVEYTQTGHTNLHWSRAMSGVFLLQLSVFAVVNAILQKVVALWNGQLLASGAADGFDGDR